MRKAGGMSREQPLQRRREDGGCQCVVDTTHTHINTTPCGVRLNEADGEEEGGCTFESER